MAFIKLLKGFIKPFEEPQRSAKIKIKFSLHPEAGRESLNTNWLTKRQLNALPLRYTLEFVSFSFLIKDSPKIILRYSSISCILNYSDWPEKCRYKYLKKVGRTTHFSLTQNSFWISFFRLANPLNNSRRTWKTVQQKNHLRSPLEEQDKNYLKAFGKSKV